MERPPSAGRNRREDGAEGRAPTAPSPLVLVSCAKGEARSLRAGYKALARHLKAARCEVRRLDRAPLTPAALDGAAIVVFGAPTQPFAPEELEALRSYLRGGGNLLVLAAEGGADAGAGAASQTSDGPAGSNTSSGSPDGHTASAASFASSNLGALLAEFGLGVGADCVIQTAFTKYSHPKEVLVRDGMLSPDTQAYCAANSRAARRTQGGGWAADENGRPLTTFAYPHGATITAQLPAVAFLSSGQVAHPCNMTVGAAWWEEGGSSGRLALLGSAAMFDDEWLGKEDNTAVLDFLLGWMLKDPACSLSAKNMGEPDLIDPRPVTHIAELAARPRVCLQEHGELPRDVTRLFAASLFKLDLSFVPQVAALRRQLLGPDAVGRASSVHSGFGGAAGGSLGGSFTGGLAGLTGGGGAAGSSSGVPGLRRGGSQLPLWRPQLEVPFPPLQPAVFPPALPELPPPALELFDLEEELAGPLERLNQVTARFLAAATSGAQQQQQQSAEQLEAYVGECAQLLGLRSRGGGWSGKERLAEVLEAVVQCKQPDCYG
ncbi:intraflagellar transport 52-like protein [Chlorella sorokiniana]|uniref:Intraflagellar transport 52-like protein n=1 Tax=Chlorella sorokiniana TaxID=3076 RepID=A0A2P6TN62_CHLSO|nr:intraflagellar transport 52-like protein [Chlorella sorokiniana]|eukprot:PRW50771.1 intraflagellar transport 52-like protein [Chlorella sorokiniana]